MLRKYSHEVVLALLVVLTFIVLSTQSEKFLTTANMLNQGRLMAEVAVVALVMTFVIASGGIDLSVGSIMGLAAILTGVFWQKLGLPLPLVIVMVLGVGVLCGLFNAFIIVRFGMPPLIATLGTLALYRGLAEGISQARSVRGWPDWFAVYGQGEVLGMPTQIWILGAITLICAVIMGATRWGRTVYAMGASEEAARFAGLPVGRAKMVIYAASGLVSALAGILFVSRVSTTRSDMGVGLELDVITAVVLGGTSIFGGKGTVIGTVLGLILIQALKNGLSLSGVRADGTIVLIGAVLIGTILISNLTDRRTPT